VSSKLDIFQRLPDGEPIWIKAVETLDQAKEQITQLAESTPGRYFVFDTNRSLIVYSHAAT
jgi:hypothetical protein